MKTMTVSRISILAIYYFTPFSCSFCTHVVRDIYTLFDVTHLVHKYIMHMLSKTSLLIHPVLKISM